MPGTVAVTSSDNGTSRAANVGDAILVSLAGNPTTGFRWELQLTGAGVLEPEGDTYEVAAGHKIGSGGTHRFRFIAKAPGRATIALRLARSWARNEPPAQTFSVEIKVSS